MDYHFEWDPQKAKSNMRKHRVSFERAATVLRDPRALSIFDFEHSRDEERWNTLGVDNTGVLLVVCHTFKEESKERVRIRILSARKATKNEIKQYQG